jgi:hypothetical protein
MATVEDLVTGAGYLPHVYCKNIQIENNSSYDEDANTATTQNIVLNLEIYQNVEGLTDSNFLNSFKLNGASLMDYIYIQILPGTNIAKLKPSNKPLDQAPVGNVYLAEQYLGDGSLPRLSHEGLLVNASGDVFYPTPSKCRRLRLSDASLLGNISGQDGLLDGLQSGKVREEIKYGKPYYVIPFRVTIEVGAGVSNFGVLMYTMVDVVQFLEDAGITEEVNFNIDSLLESAIFEGPVNTEIIFENGQVSQQRETFFLPDGRIWEGSVHLHATGFNPDPSGYAGNGSFGANKGWMAGQRHIIGQNQPRLSLQLIQNYKIQDLTDLTTGAQPTDLFEIVDPLNNTLPNVISNFLSPFDSLNKKYISKFGEGSELAYLTGGQKYYDNDSEFSKLYISRDRDNNARGVFYINMLNFMLSNSELFSLIFNQRPNININQQVLKFLTDSALSNSKILDLKLKRRRVKRHQNSIRRETFANDTAYEEAPKIIGRVNDQTGFATPNQTTGLSEIDIGPTSVQRYFTFSDKDAGQMSAGLYEYEIEIEFLDGTYKFVQDLLDELIKRKKTVERYYDFSLQSYPVDSSDTRSYFGSLTGYNTNFTRFKPYYADGVYASKFKVDVQKQFGTINPGDPLVDSIAYINYIFNVTTQLSPSKLKSLTNPTFGSPMGIEQVLRLSEAVIKTMSQILQTPKSSLSMPLTDKSVSNEYDLKNVINTSPVISTITDNHRFSELFEATTDDRVHIDYLTFYGEQKYDYHGLKRINKLDFINRMKLETLKFTNTARGSGFDGTAPIDFSETGYSFIGPSKIQFAAADEVFSYNAFRPGATNYIDYFANETAVADEVSAADFLYSENFFNQTNNERVLLSMMEYNLAYGRLQDSDVTSGFKSGVDALAQSLVDTVTDDEIQTREGYKNIFEDFGLLLHDTSIVEDFYGQSFTKQPGVQEAKKAYPENGLLRLKDQFSDGLMLSQAPLKNILHAPEQNLITQPDLKKLSKYQFDVLSSDVPNAYKFLYEQAPVQPALIDSYIYFTNKILLSPALEDSLALTLFNFGMFMKIEVYKTPQQHNTSKNRKVAKDDEGSWRMLNKQDLEGLNSSRRLFCRMQPVYNDAVQGFFLPYLDRYFIIDIDAPPTLSLSEYAAAAYGNYDNVTSMLPVFVPSGDPEEATPLPSSSTQQVDDVKPFVVDGPSVSPPESVTNTITPGAFVEQGVGAGIQQATSYSGTTVTTSGGSAVGSGQPAPPGPAGSSGGSGGGGSSY